MNNIILVGRGPNWLGDFEKASSLFEKHDVIAIGGDCLYKGHINFMATYHEKDIFPYFQKRKLEGLNTNYKVIHHEKRKDVDIIIPYEEPSGSSALLACFASIKMGYDKIVLCGCPLDGLNDKKHPYSMFQKGWEFHFNKVKNQARSMSGWTQKLLGGPTQEWINQK